MLQNKIYLNYISEILKTFTIILFGLSIIALTVRAVSFLDLIVDNGYPVFTYFKYSILNLFGIVPKFIPLSFLIALTIFILKRNQDSELLILWTSGVKKIQIVNLLFFTSLIILIFYLCLTIFLTPYALSKSRYLLGKDDLNSFLPTVRSQQFSDTFKGFTFIVEKKVNNEIKNIFLHDKNNTFKNLSSNVSKTNNTTIIAETGIIEAKKLLLFNGQVISSKKDNSENEIMIFEQLSINLGELSNNTIKQPKLQELSTLKLLSCFKSEVTNNKFCNSKFKKEIISNLSRRMILPLYIPAIALICSLLLIKTKSYYSNKFSIFIYGFILLLFTELAVRYTGISNFTKIFFSAFPFVLLIFFYTLLNFKFLNESKSI